LAPHLLPFHGSNRHVGKLTHFVTKEIFRPIPDVAVRIHVKLLDGRACVLKMTEVEGGIICFKNFSGDSPLNSPQKVLTMALHDDLYIPIRDRFD
jgi:hypothetical protein